MRGHVVPYIEKTVTPIFNHDQCVLPIRKIIDTEEVCPDIGIAAFQNADILALVGREIFPEAVTVIAFGNHLLKIGDQPGFQVGSVFASGRPVMPNRIARENI